MIPGYDMYEGFGLNLALSHMITAEDDNTDFIITLSSFKSCIKRHPILCWGFACQVTNYNLKVLKADSNI